ncbi:MAG: M1 family metallopeptidase [Bacteroidetes bacterium]|nr:M1 family metallopeptidase [Bacteroidota bacterium]
MKIILRDKIGKSILFLITFLFITDYSFPQIIFKTPLSPRNANYDINVKLDTKTKILDGSEILTWTNMSNDNIKELQFHLYLNAFKNSNSTFMKEASTGVSKRNRNISVDDWGWIDVLSMKKIDGTDLTNKIEFIQPDDGNKDDQTVIRVMLNKPLKPGKTIKLKIDFKAKLPKIIARTGYEGDYYLVGQWFPKIGVYEFPGIRNAKKGGWNCHQFHANSEFYADFGVYNVNITLPNNYVVGAVGLLQKKIENNDSTNTYTYRAEDVIDFAWTASPRFKVVNDMWNNVSIRILMQPEHLSLVPRIQESIKGALQYFNDNLGKYPYPNVTIVDPPLKGFKSSGMEYPTFFTIFSLWNMPKGLKMLENVTVHEFGHIYFMGLLASNEFEDPWLDEGFNSYFEARTMDSLYGAKKSNTDIFGYHYGTREEQRIGYISMKNPRIANNYRPSWEFTDGGYGNITYNKTGTWMSTLEGLVGLEVMNEIMKTYYEKWKFKHPGAQNFIDIVNEIYNKRLGNKYGKNLNWFFDQFLYGTAVCDYKVAKIRNILLEQTKGLYDSVNVKKLYRYKKNRDKTYRSSFLVSRLGDAVMPTEINVHFSDGTDTLITWDGMALNKSFTFLGKNKIEWVKIDPNNKNLMDINIINNSLTVRKETTVINKFTTKFLFWVENLMLSFSMLF